MLKKSKIFISMFLSVLTIIQILPLQVMAKYTTEAAQISAYSAADDEGEVQPVKELKEYRTEDQKRFLMSDGSFKVIYYSSPVHFDNGGELADIDNSIVPNEDSDSSIYDYSTKSGDFKVKFAKKTGTSSLVKLSRGKYHLNWNICGDNGKKVGAKSLRVQDIEKGGDLFSSSVAASTGAVIYNNVFDGIDLQYTVNGFGVKENIIVNEKQDKYEYSFEINTSSLTLREADNGSIIAVDSQSGETVYEIPAPFMYDKSGKVSYAVNYDLISKNKNKYLLKITADESWANDESREFPVVIDPQISTLQKRVSIDSTYIENGHPSKNHNGEQIIMVGRDSTGIENTRGLIKFVLPSLDKGDMIVDATLYMCQYFVDYYSSQTPNANVTAHTVSESWNESTVTWNTRPSFDLSAHDYSTIQKSDKSVSGGVQKSWNITKAVKQWYEGIKANNGILLKSDLESTSSSYVNSCIYAYYYNESGSQSGAYPVIAINYRNNKGLEDYWTYTTVSGGEAGTANINDYSGNLVFIHDDVSTSGLLMPVTVSHIYNGYISNTRYEDLQPYCGRGWKLSIQQTVKSNTDSLSKTNYPYIYEDSDGTEHYFYKKGSEYLDEDGLGLKLTVVSSGYQIKDDKDNVMKFNASGYLTSTSDANGNSVTLSYSGKRITKVTDGSGHIITLNVNENNYLTSVTDSAGRTMHFSYDTSNGAVLSEIEGFDNKVCRYIYSDTQNSLLRAVSPDGTGLSLEYTSASKGRRVNNVWEIASNGNSKGQRLTFDRSKYNENIIRSSGVDSVYGNDDDVYTVMQFDNFGRTVSQNSYNASGNLGAEVYKYTAGEKNSDASNIKQLNRVSRQAAFGKNTVNYARNSSFENAANNWAYADWVSSVTQTHSVSTAQSYYGNSSYKLSVTNVTADGRARLYQDYDKTVLKPGNTYTLSAYVKTSDIALKNSGYGEFGAVLGLYCECNTAANSFTAYSEYIKGTTDTNIDGGWQRISVTVTVPDDIKKVRANIAIRNATGTAYFDGVQVESGSCVNRYNMISNASFVYATSNAPDFWTRKNFTDSDTISTAYYKYDGKAIKVVGKASTDKELSQNIKVKGTENSTYVVSGWGRADAVPASSDVRKFKISVCVNYSDGTQKWQDAAEFNTTVSEWQYSARAFTLSDGTSAVKTPVSIDIVLRFNRQVNTAYFDGIQLIEEPVRSYTYDSDGNVVSVAENAAKKSSMEYSDSNLVSTTDSKGYDYKYTYDSKHNMTKAVSQRGINYKYKYNSVGESCALDITDSSGAVSITTRSSHTAAQSGIKAGAYLLGVSDENGRLTQYDYNLQKGTLSSLTDADGNITSYTYDANTDAVKSVSSSGVTNSYNYDSNNRLSSINHNSTQYSFTYDQFGNVISTSVGSRTLSTNTYESNNGNLSSAEYGNGFRKSYLYNNFGQTTSVMLNGSNAFTWKYASSAEPVSHIDNVNGLKYNYTYDTTGRLVRQTVADKTSGASKYKTEYDYDLNNNLTKFTNSANGVSFVQRYTYDKDNAVTKYDINASRNKVYSYDGLGRLNGVTLNTNTPVKSNYTYHLSLRNSEGETKYRTTNIENELIGDVGYKYFYDKLGNITEISQGVRGDGNTITSRSTKVTYEYDSLSQLSRENNLYLNKTIVYNYDNAGNITSKVVYPYTTQEDLSSLQPEQTVSYGYDDTKWHDLLTSFDNQPITYDEIGNPLLYRGSELTWNGRELTGFNSGEDTVSYSYDASGLRASKTVNSTKTEYEYVGDLLVYERRGTLEFFYMYDSGGNLSGIRYKNGDTDLSYYVVCNSRGDVDTIYNAAGEITAHYVYDSWGKTVRIENAAGEAESDTDSIGYLNPIRYRGYYYDAETNLYYVQSRYYDPEVGRFVSPDTTDILTDTQMGLTDKNLYAYCDNNPVIRADDGGDFWHIVVGAAAGALISGVVKVVSNAIEGKSVTDGLGIAMLAGAASGALASTGVGIVGIVLGNMAISMAENAANQVIKNKGFKNFGVGDMLYDGVVGGALSAFGGPGNGTKHLTNLGKQTVKRTFNSFSKRGVKTGLKEAGKAFAYYGKNSTKYYKSFFKCSPLNVIYTSAKNLLTSRYMKHKIYSVLR